MIIHKKVKEFAIYIPLISFIGLLLLSNFGCAVDGYPAYITIGDDNNVVDSTNDLFLYSPTSNFEATSEYIPWLDILNITFETIGTGSDENYTIVMRLNGDYNNNATIYLWMEVNGTISSSESYSNEYNMKQFADFHVRISNGMGYIQLGNSLGTYISHDIAEVKNDLINWTFPKVNITNLIFNTKSISQWKILARSSGEYGSTAYADLIPNFSSSTGTNGIPGYSLLIVGLVSVISVLLAIKIVRKK